MLEQAAPSEFQAERPATEVDAGRQRLTMVAIALTGIALLYTLGLEQGSILQGLVDSQLMHEIVHDARHAAGFPCH
jgi:cobalt transporter subunit CbtB